MKLIAACSNRLQCETQMMSAPAKIVCARCRNSQTCFYSKLISMKPGLYGVWHTLMVSGRLMWGLEHVVFSLRSCGCQTVSDTPLFSSVKKLLTWLGLLQPPVISCTTDGDLPPHYSVQPRSLTPLWQRRNDTAALWFDGITNSSPEREGRWDWE